MRSPSSARFAAIGIVGAAVFFFASAVATSLVFPPLGAADEGAHVAHAYAITDGGLPRVTDPQVGGPYRYREDRTLYTAHHPPLFPALIGPVIRIGNRIGDPATAVRAARILSAAFGAFAVVLTAALLREIRPERPPIWVAGATFVAATPLVAHISGLVYNDGLALAATTGVSWMGLRILRRGPNSALVAGLAAVASLAALTRISAVPIALLAIGVAAGGARRWIDRSAVIGLSIAAMAMSAGWFYVRNLVEYGDLSGGDELYDLLDRRPRDLGSLIEPAFVQARLSGLWTSREWGRGKYGVGALDTIVELAYAGLLVVGLALVVIGLFRRPRGRDGFVAVFAVLTVVAVLGGFAVHVTGGGTPHSRYLFGLLWIAGGVFAAGLGGLDRRAARATLAGLLLASATVTALGLDQVLRNTDLPIGRSGDLGAFWTDAGAPTQVALGLSVVAAAVAAAVVVDAYDQLRRGDAQGFSRTSR